MTRRDAEQLALWDSRSGPQADLARCSLPSPRSTAGANCKLQFNLGLLGPRLREEAERQKTSMAALVRRATWQMLDADGALRAAGAAPEPFEHSTKNGHFHLNLPPDALRALTASARAADMPRGEFVWWLYKGISPAPLPADHAANVQALRESTGLLAVMSTDVSEFLRVLTRTTPSMQDLAPYRGRIQSLDKDVRAHMQIASLVIEQLKPFRRARW